MKRSLAVNVVTAAIVLGVPVAGLYAGSWLLFGAAEAPAPPAVVDSAPPTKTVPPTTKSEPVPEVARYDSVADYFRAGNPNAATYRLGEQWIVRKSFSKSSRDKIHRENGGCCQVCGSTKELELELEHRRGLQNGGGNERSNLGTLCHECHLEKTAMDKSLRRQREKLLKQGR